MKYKFLIILCIISLISSCRKEDPQLSNPYSNDNLNSWEQIFEAYWNSMNNAYVFWEVDPTDWNKVYNDYKPQFQKLKIGNSADSITVKRLFEEITSNIIDHHYTLSLYKANSSEIWFSIYPGFNEIEKRDYYHPQYSEEQFFNTISENIEKGRIKDMVQAHLESENVTVCSYLIDDNIAYLFLNSFSISENWADDNIRNAIYNFHAIIDNTLNLKGIIIDMRQNGGGNLDDLTYIISPRISREYTIGYNRCKNGMGRLDYSPWTPMVVYPFKTEDKLAIMEKIPVIGLVDIRSASMSELTPLAIRELPKGYIVGERTFGAQGPLEGIFENSYAGEVRNKAFSIYTSTLMTKATDGKCYEGKGITPDKEALYNEVEFLKGNDTQLDAAIQLINEKSN